MVRECRLNELEPGERASVKEILVEEGMHRRLLDLGLVGGTWVECVARSPGGNPAAYRIRGAVIAIREEHSRQIIVNRDGKGKKVIALAGNPNVGKSTVFNGLTGMHQHTGNWPGKTVSNARGTFHTAKQEYELVDLPGTYSLMAHSVEEEIAREYLCLGDADMVVVVCDATCLERNLNLVLQIMDLEEHVILCINLMDEAEKKKITIDLEGLSQELEIPVVGVTAHKKKSLQKLTQALDVAVAMQEEKITVPEQSLTPIEKSPLEECLEERTKEEQKAAEVYVKRAEEICRRTVRLGKEDYDSFDRRLDRYFTNRFLGYPMMFLLLAVIFWITIAGANYPSQLLSSFLFGIEDWLTGVFLAAGAPDWLHGLLVLGMYRVLAWVVSVMLPPMAIFFPLFTLLEDAGFLPRIAFNLDHVLLKCRACGKQALTMAMGFGCNAVGVMGCRIIDSPRERLIAVLTNSFVPCNGRFPTLIMLLSMFFIGSTKGLWESIKSALFLSLLILFGMIMTFLASRLLSTTILKGEDSGFTLELPSYRRPQIGKVIVRSVMDRTLFVLGRAVTVAVPAGMVIWLMANITIQDKTVLNLCAEFLNPFARLLGMDGVIFMAFILGIPANEIVMPIMIMAYLQQGQLVETGQLSELKTLLLANGWTAVTALCTMLFSLLHWPCATTLLTIKKETGDIRYFLLGLLLPTATGMLCCFLVRTVATILGIP